MNKSFFFSFLIAVLFALLFLVSPERGGLIPFILVFVFLAIKFPLQVFAFIVIPTYFIGFLFEQQFPAVNFGGINIYPFDFFIFLNLIYILSLVIVDPKRFFYVVKKNKWLVLIILWVFFQILRGIGIYRQQAVGDGRRFLVLIFILGMLFFIKKREDVFLILKSLAYSSLILSILVIGRLANVIPYDPSAQQLYFRVLPAGAVLFLLYSSVFVFLNYIGGNLLKFHVSAKYFGFVCFVLVLVTQHRSVWLTAVVAMALILLIFRKAILNRIMPYGVTFLAIIFVTLFLVTSTENKIVQHLSDRLIAFSNPLSDETSAFRLATWEAQVSEIQSHPVLGSGLGGYYRWTYRGHTKNISPHNLYFDILLKLGVIGLILYFLLQLNVVRNLFRYLTKFGDEGIVAKSFLILIVATHFYFIAYGIDFMHCVLFGLALSWVNIHSRKQINLKV